MVGGGAGNGKHTYTHTQFLARYTGWMEPRARIGRNLDTSWRGQPTKLNCRAMNSGRTQWGVGGAGNGKHTHTHSVPRDTQGGWSFGRESDAILTHVGVARPLN